VSGEVVSGDGRGRTIGIPTANLDIWSQQAQLKTGVYACNATLHGVRHQAVTNIGQRPTFESDQSPIRIETHILDFRGEIYGEIIELDFIEYLREEQKFSGIDELVSQIHKDIHRARQILG
jgi:riboflavin kinase/FMN adenylyltransferase